MRLDRKFFISHALFKAEAVGNTDEGYLKGGNSTSISIPNAEGEVVFGSKYPEPKVAVFSGENSDPYRVYEDTKVSISPSIYTLSVKGVNLNGTYQFIATEDAYTILDSDAIQKFSIKFFSNNAIFKSRLYHSNGAYRVNIPEKEVDVLDIEEGDSMNATMVGLENYVGDMDGVENIPLRNRAPFRVTVSRTRSGDGLTLKLPNLRVQAKGYDEGDHVQVVAKPAWL